MRTASATSRALPALLLLLMLTPTPKARVASTPATQILTSAASSSIGHGARVFAYLIVGRSLRTDSIRTYLFPVYMYEGSRYRTARMTGPPAAGRFGFERVTGSVEGIDAQRSIINRVRKFTLYERGLPTGHYTVNELQVIAPSGCQTELVGIGRPSWIRAPDFKKGERGLIAGNQKAQILRFVALSGISSRDVRIFRPYAPSAREREFVTSLAKAHLEKFVKEQAPSTRITPEGTPQLRRALTFDAEGAGKQEVVAELSVRIAPTDFGGFELSEVRIVIVAKSGPPPKALLVLLPFGFDALEAIDMSGDGRVELLFGYGSYFSMNYDLYSLEGEHYVSVLSEGMPSGC